MSDTYTPEQIAEIEFALSMEAAYDGDDNWFEPTEGERFGAMYADMKAEMHAELIG